jgi:hypothetical protein
MRNIRRGSDGVLARIVSFLRHIKVLGFPFYGYRNCVPEVSGRLHRHRDTVKERYQSITVHLYSPFVTYLR